MDGVGDSADRLTVTTHNEKAGRVARLFYLRKRKPRPGVTPKRGFPVSVFRLLAGYLLAGGVADGVLGDEVDGAGVAEGDVVEGDVVEPVPEFMPEPVVDPAPEPVVVLVAAGVEVLLAVLVLDPPQ